MDRAVASALAHHHVDRLLIDERVAGDFLAPHHGAQAPSPWPTMDIPTMHQANEIPAVDPEISAQRARSASAPTHQASPRALIDEPFSDYNAVLPTGRVQFDAPPPPTDTPTPGQPHTVFNDTGWACSAAS